LFDFEERLYKQTTSLESDDILICIVPGGSAISTVIVHPGSIVQPVGLARGTIYKYKCSLKSATVPGLKVLSND
jgi:hypothetical protein